MLPASCGCGEAGVQERNDGRGGGAKENQLRLNLLDQDTAGQLSAQTRLGLNMERFHASAATGKQTANEET